ncbi:7tm 6 domain containing protein, partial [Asbolus verrucosus]
MAIGKDDRFQFAIKCYDMSGLRKSCPIYRRIISVCILYPLLLILYSLMIFNIQYQKNIFEIAAVFESVSTLGYLVTRKTILLIHASLFEEMIQDRSRFWHYDLCGKRIGDKCRNQMALCVSIIKFIWISTAISVVFRSSTPLFVEESVVPEKWTWTKVDEEICWMKLIECFEHHRFLLSVHRKLNNAFSEFFVCFYIVSIGGICIQFFILLDGSADFIHLIKIILFIMIVNALIILVIIPVGDIEIEAEKLIFGIYSIDWYKTGSVRIRKFVLFWLIKAQVPVLIT